MRGSFCKMNSMLIAYCLGRMSASSLASSHKNNWLTNNSLDRFFISRLLLHKWRAGLVLLLLVEGPIALHH